MCSLLLDVPEGGPLTFIISFFCPAHLCSINSFLFLIVEFVFLLLKRQVYNVN